MASTDLGVLLRWAADGGAARSRPRPQHGEHRRGSAQYCGDSGRIRFPQVGHPKQAQRLHSRLPGLTNPNPPRAPPPGRSTQQMPQVFQWLSYLTFQKYGCELLIVTEFEGLDFTCSRFARWRRPPLRARGERSCVCSSCIFKNMQTFIFYYAICCYLLDIQSSRSDWKVFLVSLFFQTFRTICPGPVSSPTATRSSTWVIPERCPDTRWTFCSSTPSCLLSWCSAWSATRSETGWCVTDAVGQPWL